MKSVRADQAASNSNNRALSPNATADDPESIEVLSTFSLKVSVEKPSSIYFLDFFGYNINYLGTFVKETLFYIFNPQISIFSSKKN